MSSIAIDKFDLVKELENKAAEAISGGYRGEFKVYANSSIGTRFTNNSGKTKTYSFQAFGSWFCADDGRGPVDANGNIRSTPSNLDPNLPGCALVIRRSNNLYEKAGKDGIFTLQNGDHVNFVMNDQFDKFGDNSGWLDVIIED